MKRLLILTSFALLVVTAWGQQERKFIRKGTTEYNGEKYVESEVEYRKALEKDPKSFEAQFNMADALYKQKKLNESLEQFQALAGTQTDKTKLAQIYHNMGNIYFAADKLDESIKAYKDALKNNPGDNETRYNLIAAQKKKQKKEQEQQQDQKKEQEQEQQKKEEEKDQQQDQKHDQKQEQQQEQNQNQMNRQDAERILNALQQDEDDLQKEKRKVKATERAAIEKNW